MAGTTRRVSRFSWSAVDAGLVRQILEQVYLDAGDEEQARQVRRLSDRAARATAAERLGEPPNRGIFSKGVDDVLREKWLPRAKARVVDELTATVSLTLSGAALAEPVETKAQQVRFLQSRNWTNNLRTNLRKAFVRAHRDSVKVEVTRGRDGGLRGPTRLVGKGETADRPWYDHQVHAHARLDELWAQEDRFGARLVLPTGAGKTDTVASWLLHRLAEDERLRVLWLVHQQELASQAMARFAALARLQPAGFERRGRVIHSSGSALSTLTDDELTVAAVTYQSFRDLDARKKRQLAAFLARPTVVVVDEAHHAGAPSFHALLDFVDDQPELQGVLGLTATPYPSAPGARARFMERFRTLVHEVEVAQLIREKVLARPVVTTIQTGETVPTLDASQLAQATSSDIPAEVLAQLDVHHRNRLVVKTWSKHQDAWGKTLVFATNIDHANKLTGTFRRARADVRALHSGIRDRSKVLEWFRAADGSAVLVSVGMLTEGVDLPDARSAFLVRPTTSPILMRQMVGRVLRGPRAGGELEAHVVHFRDEWANLPDVLYPEEVLPDCRPDSDGRSAAPWTPGAIIDDEELALRADVAAQAARAFERLAALFDADDDDPYNDRPPEPLIRGARIVGYYDLGGFPAAVFEHQRPGYDALLADALGRDELRGTSLLSYFDDSPPPYPSLRALKELVALAREYGEAPSLEPCHADIGPERAAREILDAGPLTEAERFELIHQEYQKSLNRVAFANVEAFEEAVAQQLRELRRTTRRLDAEAPPGVGIEPSSLPRLPRIERDLDAIRWLAVETARDVLPPALAQRLSALPEVMWTKRCVSSTWGHWSLRMAGKGRGKAMIRINRVLRTRPKHVPDEMLAYLVFHEILHHLLPGQGHDAEFREMEARWPDADRWDREFDTLHERWDLRPESYPTDVG